MEPLWTTPLCFLPVSRNLEISRIRTLLSCVLVFILLTIWTKPVSFFQSGLEAEVPLRPGGGHGEAGWTGEEDWQSRGGVQALLGGPAVGQTGQSAATRTYWVTWDMGLAAGGQSVELDSETLNRLEDSPLLSRSSATSLQTVFLWWWCGNMTCSYYCKSFVEAYKQISAGIKHRDFTVILKLLSL